MPYGRIDRERYGESRSSRALDPAAVLGALVLLLAGCGLKGPLYLPEGQARVVAPTPAERAERADPAQDSAATDARKRVIPVPAAPQTQKDPSRKKDAADPAQTPHPAPREPASTPAAPRSGQTGEPAAGSVQPDD